MLLLPVSFVMSVCVRGYYDDCVACIGVVIVSVRVRVHHNIGCGDAAVCVVAILVIVVGWGIGVVIQNNSNTPSYTHTPTPTPSTKSIRNIYVCVAGAISIRVVPIVVFVYDNNGKDGTDGGVRHLALCY